MINLPVANTPAPEIGFDIDKLDSLLADLESEHEHLLELAGLQREAIISADAKELGLVVKQTAQALNRIAGIEHTRQQVIKRPDGTIPTVDQITQELRHQHDDQHAEALTNRSTSLRALMHRVKEEHEAVRVATLALSNHMSGLMEQVSAKLSHTGTYGRRGAVDPGRSQVVSSLDTIQ
jgi:hypothetical protein